MSSFDPFPSILPVDKLARPLADLLGAELRVFVAGHFLPLDAPEPVSAALCAFFAKTVVQITDPPKPDSRYVLSTWYSCLFGVKHGEALDDHGPSESILYDQGGSISAGGIAHAEGAVYCAAICT